MRVILEKDITPEQIMKLKESYEEEKRRKNLEMLQICKNYIRACARDIFNDPSNAHLRRTPREAV